MADLTSETENGAVMTRRSGAGIKRIPVLFLAGAICFMAVAWPIRVWLRPSLDEHNVLKAKIGLALRYPKTNIVAIGPSYTEMGFNPDVFDAEMKTKGIISYSLNMGLVSLSVVEMQSVIHDLLKSLCCVKYFVMSPCFECLMAAAQTDSQRSISFFDWWHGLMFFDYLLHYDVMPPDVGFTRPKLLGHIVAAVFRHYTSLGLAANYFGFSRFFANVMRLTAESWMNLGPRGFSPSNHHMSEAEARKYASSLMAYRRDRKALLLALDKRPLPDSVPDYVSDKMFDVFLEQVRFLRSKGIQVLVAIPPNTWAYTFQAALVTKLRERCGNDIPFVDFGDIDKWRELFLPPDTRVNTAHLSPKGAAIWSKAIADEFVKSIDMKAPPQPHQPICARSESERRPEHADR